MGAQGIIEMEGKKTRIVNIKVIQRFRLLHHMSVCGSLSFHDHVVTFVM